MAKAEPTAAELAAARDMFNEARRAEDASNWTEARRLLRAVADVKMTAQVRFHLGLCEEQLGQLVEALNDFERAKIEAAEQHVATVAEEAPQHAGEVRARIPKLVLVLPQGTHDVKIAIDEQPVPASLFTRAMPLNPGEHVIAVNAPGKTFQRRIAFAEREEKRVEVTFSATAVAVQTKPRDPLPLTAKTTDEGTPPTAPNRTLGWVAVSVGGAALLGAGVSTLVRASALSDIENQCPSHADCPPSLRDSQSRATTFGALAVGLGVGGVACTALGLVLLTRPTPPKATAHALTVGPWASNGGAGAVGRLVW